jgi:hypothetical protein
MKKAQPLYVRLYRDPHLVDLVRLIGYDGLPVAEAKERLKPLNEQYGVDKMKAAVEEIVRIDTSVSPPIARLTETARKLAWQLLGPPPEKATDFHAAHRWPLLPCA